MINDAFKTFLDDALPSGQSKHVLSVGDLHFANEHRHFLRGHLDEFKNRHNVKTIGLEYPPMMNVLFWAYRDGNLPVPKGKERAYITAMVQSYMRGDLKETAAQQAEFIMDALDKGIDVVGFDGRKLFNEYAKLSAVSSEMIKRHPEITQALHSNPDQAGNAQLLDGAISELGERYPQIRTVSRDSIATDLRFGVLVGEIASLFQRHPEYYQRLADTEKLSATLRKEGNPRDAISAALLADATKNTDGNIITIYGAGHLGGRTTPSAMTDGKLTEFMDAQGFTVTPAIMVGRNEFPSVMAPIEADKKRAPSPAVSSQRMNLIALGSAGADSIVLKDIHHGISPEVAAASDIGRYIDTHLQLFAATSQQVAQDSQGVLRSAKSYLSQVIRKNLLSSDAPNPKELELRDTIDDLVKNDAASHGETLHVMNSALRYVESSSKLLPANKNALLPILKQFVGYLENYTAPDSLAWQQTVSQDGPEAQSNLRRQ